MRTPTVEVAPEVAKFLGAAMVSDIVREAPLTPCCAVCGRAGRGDFSVVVTEGGPEVFTVGLAHRQCSGSVINRGGPSAPAVGMSAAAWLRAPGTDPAPVLVLSPHVRLVRITAGGDTQDLLLAGLLGAGFGPVSERDQALPDDAGLRFGLVLRRVWVGDSAGVTLYAGAPGASRAWCAAARTGRRIGVVLAGGLDVPGAIAAGRAIGASATISHRGSGGQ